MSAPTTVNGKRSAYPATVVDLLPDAQALAERTGEVPSLRALSRELRVGTPKAAAVREALLQGTGAAGPDAAAATATDVPELSPTVEASTLPTARPDTPPAAVPDVPEVVVDGPGTRQRVPRSWPLLVIAVPAAVAIWSGWVGLGELTGFGPVNLLPGIGHGLTINTAITLPIGVEAYASYALRVWLAGAGVPPRARRFARWSAVSSLLLGIGGQGAYHLMTALGWSAAPWPIVVTVSALPVAVLGMAAGLTHLLRADR